MFRRRNVLRDKLLSRFVVTTTAGGSLVGLLREFDDDRLVFVDVKLLSEGQSLAVAGDVYIDRVKVEYMQRVSDAAV